MPVVSDACLSWGLVPDALCSWRVQLLQQDQGGLGGNVPPSEGASGSGPPPTSSSSLTDYFVEIVDGEFVLGCNQFPVSGWNE